MSAMAITLAGALGAGQAMAAPIFDDGLPADWSCTGNCGASGPDGVVTQAPIGGSQYGWVSTSGGVYGTALPDIGGSGSPQNGSKLVSNFFTVDAATELEFAFNYVTSDGAGYADYAWARLLDQDMNQVALLFTARTTPGGDTVPGFAMPDPEATLNPESTPIIGGAPVWSPLGGSSDSCWNINGCGYTGWILSSYEIAQAGTYALEFGVVNWNDTSFQSGLAFDGITVGGQSITQPNPVPVSEPGTLALLGLGLLALGGRRRLMK